MSSIRQRIDALVATGATNALTGIMRGLEKESLRVNGDGRLATSPHHTNWGSALTHPEITTDFSEVLLEFITPPSTNVNETLAHLDRIHRFIYSQLDDEYLWVGSMPCVLGNDDDIPVAQYGSSNVAKMKTIYRLGLGHRYGRSMQTIAGIHYNFSLPDTFWQSLHTLEASTLSLRDFKTQRYLDLIRNFRRHFWLLLYLFGAAPAVCGSFVAGRDHSLTKIPGDSLSLHAPMGTSLRMGDLGYQSQAQQSLAVTYNNLPEYLTSLCRAITQPHPDYEKIGVRDADGNYRQLNTGILQIENEFYSTIRPKRTSQRGETALGALAARGVEYIEVRCIDLNPYEALGISAEQIYLLDTFLLFCLLDPSPAADPDGARRVHENQQRIVYMGRDPELELLNGKGKSHKFRDWSVELLDEMQDVAQMLDQVYGTNVHCNTVSRQREKIYDASLTPSARILSDMQSRKLSHAEFMLAQSRQHGDYFRSRPLSDETMQSYRDLAELSLRERRVIELGDEVDFETYLNNYYKQYDRCACGAI